MYYVYIKKLISAIYVAINRSFKYHTFYTFIHFITTLYQYFVSFSCCLFQCNTFKFKLTRNANQEINVHCVLFQPHKWLLLVTESLKIPCISFYKATKLQSMIWILGGSYQIVYTSFLHILRYYFLYWQQGKVSQTGLQISGNLRNDLHKLCNAVGDF